MPTNEPTADPHALRCTCGHTREAHLMAVPGSRRRICHVVGCACFTFRSEAKRSGRPRTIRELRREPRYRGSRLQLSDAQSDRVREAYRRAQKKAGSQMALAAQLGCSQQSVSSVFSARVSLAMAALLSMHLRMLVADLVGEP